MGSAAVFAAVVALQGCSAVPDWANPVSWYDNTFGDQPAESSASTANQADTAKSDSSADEEKASGGAQKFPRLSSVPDRPKTSSPEDRKALQQSLAADRSGAQYSDEDLRGRPPSAAPVSPQPAPAVTAAAAPEPPQPAAAPVPVPTPVPPSAPSVAPAAGPATPPGTPARAPAPYSAPPPQIRTAAAAPVPGNSVDEVYAQALAQSASTVTTAPANAAFSAPRGAPVQRFATAVPPLMQQNYNASMATPVPSLPPAGTPTARSGNPAFAAAGSQLADTVFFARGSANLSGDDRQALRDVVSRHKTQGGIIRIVGHASDDGSSSDPWQQKLANFDISQRRAEAVAGELRKLGAKSNSIFVEAAEDGPATGGSAEGRRAEIFLEN
ncbi:MAG TPA: OmpA family protein [Candidatus Cybelea sp.]|nr:OmpA family protein [Candidatus Cybelea sp.]